jgi:hypothetical protein
MRVLEKISQQQTNKRSTIYLPMQNYLPMQKLEKISPNKSSEE